MVIYLPCLWPPSSWRWECILKEKIIIEKFIKVIRSSTDSWNISLHAEFNYWIKSAISKTLKIKSDTRRSDWWDYIDKLYFITLGCSYCGDVAWQEQLNKTNGHSIDSIRLDPERGFTMQHCPCLGGVQVVVSIFAKSLVSFFFIESIKKTCIWQREKDKERER